MQNLSSDLCINERNQVKEQKELLTNLVFFFFCSVSFFSGIHGNLNMQKDVNNPPFRKYLNSISEDEGNIQCPLLAGSKPWMVFKMYNNALRIFKARQVDLSLLCVCVCVREKIWTLKDNEGLIRV